jgi:phage gpG-like protein
MPIQRRQEFPTFKKEIGQSTKLFRDLPRLAGNTALNFFKDSWDHEGFVDHRRERWMKRKVNTGSRRRLLVKTGRLRRSLRMRYTQRRVIISTDVPYAKIHNEGGTISGSVNVRAHKRRNRPVRAHTRTVNTVIPKRQFMGHSHTLDKRLELLVTRSLTQIYG